MASILFLTPPSMNVETVVRSLTSLRMHDVSHRFLGKTITDLPDDFEPDIVIYIGAVCGVYSIDPDILKTIKTQKTKTINLFLNGGDKLTHSLLERFAQEDTFTLTVNVDGNHEWPSRPQDMTLIGAVDPTAFIYKTVKKEILLGSCSASSPIRDAFLKELDPYLTKGERNEEYGHYDKYADFILKCKSLVNINWVAESNIATGVNYKLFECGYADTLFLESAGSYVSKWFTPCVEYLEYEIADDVLQIRKEIEENPDEYWHVRDNLIRAINEKYSNNMFWEKVFERLNCIE